MRGLQVCFKMRDAFPLLDHDDRVGRCGLEADAGGMIHQRGIAVAAGLLQNGRNNFRELIENRPGGGAGPGGYGFLQSLLTWLTQLLLCGSRHTRGSNNSKYVELDL